MNRLLSTFGLALVVGCTPQTKSTEFRTTLIAYHFDERRIDAVVDTVLETTASRYPDGAIPPHSRWRHFEVGDINRWGQLPLPSDAREQARIATELTVLSVLLDAGAGSAWRYFPAICCSPYRAECRRLSREGAVALFSDGLETAPPWQVFGLRSVNRVIRPRVATSRFSPVS